MRLIDAIELVRDIDIAFKGIKANEKEVERFSDLCGLIWMQPIVDPVKHGIWIVKLEPAHEHVECSACGVQYYEDDLLLGMNEFPNYCPNCGAKMDK